MGAGVGSAGAGVGPVGAGVGAVGVDGNAGDGAAIGESVGDGKAQAWVRLVIEEFPALTLGVMGAGLESMGAGVGSAGDGMESVGADGNAGDGAAIGESVGDGEA